MMEIVPDVKACAELLKDLNLQEKGDYCKCLQLPVRDTWKKSKMSDEIAQEFHRYPEHLLYGLEEYEYEELLDWMKLPYGRCEIPEWNNMFVKVFGFGLKKRTCKNILMTWIMFYSLQKN